ncbi:MAG TPA: cobyrinate a,c-diamide synthase [Pseudomonadales bacterium]|nr:cobyrinate a,c-diamide synthase [Pseudomonadales bacterium]
MSPIRHCPALFITAPASGQGKTTVTAALARLHTRAGRRVRVFKTGPDFLDPMIHEQASGYPVYQLDLWMGGEQHCRELLYQAASEADLILIEGVMGLFDGKPSSADLAILFNIPVLAVINATAMAQTFGAIAHGLATYRHDLPFSGVLANRVASASHAGLLRDSLPKGMQWYGALFRQDDDTTLPSRHLGLVQAEEIADLDVRLDRMAEMLAAAAPDLLPAPVAFHQAASEIPVKKILNGKRIAIARDSAFAFLYRANVDCLRELGAELVFFSPLIDKTLPICDAVYLPGGYPELHLDALAENSGMKQALADHHAANKPLVAECGGLLYLLDSLTDKNGSQAAMVGLLTGNAVMQKKLANLGLHSVALPEGIVRGHTYHHSTTECALTPLTMTAGKRGKPEPVYREARLHASYLHMYFPSNPDAVASLFSL